MQCVARSVIGVLIRLCALFLRCGGLSGGVHHLRLPYRRQVQNAGVDTRTDGTFPFSTLGLFAGHTRYGVGHGCSLIVLDRPSNIVPTASTGGVHLCHAYLWDF